MDIGNWGGGLVLLVAAVLWVVYLMPSWHARRQYLATERNAIRLQQTLRILAQTAELPDEVRVEMNARSLAEAQRVAASEEARRRAIVRAHEAARQREITRRLAEQEPELARASAVPALTAMRMRRSRLGATGLGFVGLVVAVVTLVVAPAMWLLIVAGLAAAGGSVAVLVQLAQVDRARKERAATSAPVVRRASRRSGTGQQIIDPVLEAPPAPVAEDRSWTPTSVPKPLYVARPQAPVATESSSALAARLRARVAEEAAAADATRAAARAVEEADSAARADASLARVSRMRADVEEAAASLSAHDQGRLAERLGLRAASASASASASSDAGPSAASPVVPETPAAPSRWAGMGVIDEDACERTDIDAVLRRRRAV
jgi:hypothetical protein